MLKKTFITLSLPFMLYAQTIPELFDALKLHSQTLYDDIAVKKAEVYNDLANSKLYPTINLFASYDNYSSPTGMIPVPPNSMIPMVQDPKIAQPFSYNIYRGGANISMPIFIKSIFTMAEKSRLIHKSTKAQKHINLIKNEALIVGSDADFLYLSALKNALDAKEKSLKQTKKTLKIKVKNGRASASSLYKINDRLNQISIAKNNIELQKQKIISIIKSLTGITMKKPVKLKISYNIKTTQIASLEPMRKKIQADKLNIKAQKEKLYPAVFAHGSYSYSKGESYNNYKDVNEEYGNVGVTINIPLLVMNQYDEINIAELKVKSSQTELQKLTDELEAKAQMLKNSLPLLDDSITLYKQSINDKQKLLKIAKLNFESGRLSTEEYLRYEDDIVSAKASLYKAKAQKIQTQMELAMIYANNIEEMVK